MGSSGGGGGSGKASARAQQAAIAEQQRQFEVTKGLFKPYREGGERALPQYEEGIRTLPETPDIQGFKLDAQALRETPGYQFTVGEGERQIDRLAGKNRQLTSGNRLVAAQQYGQQLGDTLYNQEYNRGISKLLQQYGLEAGRHGTGQDMLLNLTNLGQASAAQQSAQGQQTADNVSNLLQNQAQLQEAQSQGKPSGLLGGGGSPSGALGGAASGAAIGSVVPGVGTAVGAVVGGIIGLL